MKYSELVHFEPIESIVQLAEQCGHGNSSLMVWNVIQTALQEASWMVS